MAYLSSKVLLAAVSLFKCESNVLRLQFFSSVQDGNSSVFWVMERKQNNPELFLFAFQDL